MRGSGFGKRSRLPSVAILTLILASFFCFVASGADGILQIRNGYFWDPVRQEYFIPRGIAYQIWNPPVGANQSFDQVEYDLLEFKKMYANSVRVEFVWSQVEIKDDEYDWSKPDFLVATAEKLGLRLFVIIGFQYPPSWFPKEWRGINDRFKGAKSESEFRSDVLNYEHPEARRVYREHITRVTERYKNSPAIGAWILGNEYAYFDLWEDPLKYPARRFLGYDPDSLARFKEYLSSIYGGSIAALNANWGTSFASFDAVEAPARFPPDHKNPGYHDLIQWRKQSIGDFVALGATAARRADPNHLQTYSMVGGIFNGNDANNTAEDGKTIVDRCASAGAPLDFWSVNNYAWASLGSELRSADFGIAKYQALTGLPIMISETGHSSSEDSLGPGAAERQPKAIPSTLWESLLSGAIGVHLFHWNDRSQFTQGYFLRERGFGIVNQNRTVKSPVYENVLGLFRRMADIRLDNLLGGSSNPAPDVQYFWSTNAEIVWPRANQENAMLWGALKRAGYQPGILDDAAFERGAYTNAPALLLSRCTQMHPKHLDRIATEVLPGGIHVHANADLPGQFDAYYRRNPDWAARMISIFGLSVASAVPGFETSPTNGLPEYRNVRFRGAASLGSFTPSYSDNIDSWKIWHGLRAVAGITVVTHTGVNNSQTAQPALQVNSHTRAKTAVNTFALGDTFGSSSVVHLWDIRYDWLRAIYRDHFRITPAIELSGPNSAYKYVISDYRFCRNGSVLISLLNEHTNTASITLSAPGLLKNKTVENLTSGGILADNSSGDLKLNLTGDDFVLLYAYDRRDGRDESLVNPSPNKIWFESATALVWPRTAGYTVALGHDTRDADLNLVVSFDRLGSHRREYGRSSTNVRVNGKGTTSVEVSIPDADLNDPLYVSTRAGGQYVFRAWLEKDGARVSETELPVRLSLGVHPVTAPPTALVPRQKYSVPVEWDELPSYQPGDATPLNRAPLWDSLQSTAQHYAVVLELRSAGQVVAQDMVLTRSSSGTHTFSVEVPSGAAGPFTWAARVESAPIVATQDVVEGFEGRDRGAVWPPDALIKPVDPSYIAPWASFTYAFPNKDRVNLWQNQGVQLAGSAGSQSAFLVMTNPPNQLFSGFGLSYVFKKDWALPPDRKLWTNYVFSYDFKEARGHNCILEMQIKNADPAGAGKWLQFSKPYIPGRSQWDTVRASLDQFSSPTGLSGVFEPDKVHEIVVNVLMISSNVQYVASFDEIRFDGPDLAQPGGEIFSSYTSANDLLRMTGISRIESGQVLISWSGEGILQAADESTGPWVDLPKSASPQSLPLSGTRKFYRLRH